MKSTNELLVDTDIYLKNNILIHPNDGFELGLMKTHYSVKIFANVTIDAFNNEKDNFREGILLLNNQCKFGTIKLCAKYWRQIGMPKKIKLFYTENKVLITNI